MLETQKFFLPLILLPFSTIILTSKIEILYAVFSIAVQPTLMDTLGPAGSRTQVSSYPGKRARPLHYRMRHRLSVGVAVADKLPHSGMDT